MTRTRIIRDLGASLELGEIRQESAEYLLDLLYAELGRRVNK